MIKILLSISITLLFIFETQSQSRVPIEEYGKRDWPGGYIDLDGEFHEGLLYIYPVLGQKLRFRENETDSPKKLRSKDILGFIIGEDEFHTLKNFPLVAVHGIKANFANGFGRMIALGKVEAFQVYKYEYNQITGEEEICENLVLFKDDFKMAVPINRNRLKRGWKDNIKNNLKDFFDNDPHWNERIDLLINKESGFVGIYDLVEEYNQRI
ncbi:MAG: hypothetical protein KTR26_15390 [Flammeovirgaceae bacterium]|nr:hypothetical protein [Flammeovirgaceae bacterium]